MQIDVTAPTQEHEAGWRSLWDQYCDGAIEQRVSDATWTRLLDPASAIAGLVTVSGGEVIGFVNYVVHEGTWETKPICYIEDVFVSKLYRGRGSLVARAMADQLVQRVRSGQWSRLWGITASDNLIAQRRYSGFAEGKPYVRYVMRGDQ
jgi:GNAT superfamily N-acetyltransferase